MYLRIIKAEDMEWTGKHGRCLEGDVTVINDIQDMRRRKKVAGQYQEVVWVHFNDGTTEEITGHVVGHGPGNGKP